MYRTRTLAIAVALAATTLGSAVALAGSPATPTSSTSNIVERRGDSAVVADDLGSVGAVADPVADSVGDPVAAAADTDPMNDADEPSAFPTVTAAPSNGHHPPPTSGAPPVRETIPGGGTAPPPAPPSKPIGELDDNGPVPAGLGLVAPPATKGTPAVGGGPGGLAAAPSCSHQCISRGDAYARGFGALLVVETTVPSEMFISAIADLDGDGNYEESYFEWSPSNITKHLWALDHLQSGTTYHAMVAATDEHGHTSHAWGTFTTLSRRNVFVSFGDLEVVGGPSGTDGTDWLMDIDGAFTNVTPGEQGILHFYDRPRALGLEFMVVRNWDCELLEYWDPNHAGVHGHDSASCLAWNSTSIAVDLDAIPTGTNHWTSTSIQRTLATDMGDGDLPPGYGDPSWFFFSVPVTLHVSYS